MNSSETSLLQTFNLVGCPDIRVLLCTFLCSWDPIIGSVLDELVPIFHGCR